MYLNSKLHYLMAKDNCRGCPASRSFSQRVSQSAFELRELKFVTRGRQLGRLHALAGEEQLVGHLAKSQPYRKSGQGKQGGAGKDAAQSHRELAIRQRVRSDRGHGSVKRRVREGVDDSPDHVVERNPAHVLAS